MKRKNFTSIPNEFFIDETKTNKLDLDYRHEYVFIKMQACQSKWGKNFQKSQQLMANICNISKSTFIRIVDELINKGIVTKNVIQVENSKEKESCYWTVNFEYEFQIETTPIQNDNGVLSEWQGGVVNMTKKEDLKDFKDLELEEEEEEYIYNKASENNPLDNPLITYWQTELETNSYKEFLTASGFKHDTIKEIIKKTATKISKKELSHLDAKNKIVLNDAFKEFNKDKNNDIRSYSGLFVFKLGQASEKYSINMALQEKELQERATKEEESWNNPKPFYNYLES